MYLTEEEKNIIRKISKEEISDISDYLRNAFTYTTGFLHPDKYTIGVRGVPLSFPPKHTIVEIESEAVAIKKISTFLALCAQLEALHYVVIEDIKTKFPQEVAAILLNEPERPLAFKAMEKLDKHKNFRVFPLSSLDDFVKNDFKTAEEIDREIQHQALYDERRARIKSQRWTATTAIFSIISSIGLAIFNWATYSTERHVVIKNLDSLKQPFQISISKSEKPNLAIHKK